MIAVWMLYCSLCAVGISLAALLAERVLLGGRGSVRFVWIGAVAVSVLVPLAAFGFAQRKSAPAPAAAVVEAVPPAPVIAAPPSVPSEPINRAHKTKPTFNWRATLARLDEPLAVAWATLSFAAAINFFGGVIVLVWMRRSWKRRTVLGIPVYVSERTGPAVVGAVTPAIVVPEW